MYNAPLRSQHIAKTHGDMTHVPIGSGCQDEFAYTLCATHYAGGVHSLVRRNQQERITAAFFGCIEQGYKREDVVAYSLVDVAFHHGDVFVGSGMKDNLNFAGSKNRNHAMLIGDVRHVVLRWCASRLLRKSLFQKKKTAFILVDTDEIRRQVEKQLPA